MRPSTGISFIYRNILYNNDSFLNLFPNKMVWDVDVFRAKVMFQVYSESNRGLIIPIDHEALYVNYIVFDLNEELSDPYTLLGC